MKIKFKIKGLDCANCASELEDAVRKIDGVNEASISFMSERMVIEIDETRKEDIMEEIKRVINKEEPDVTINEV